MPIAHQAFLLLVVGGMLMFAFTLGAVTWWSNRPPRKPMPVEDRRSAPTEAAKLSKAA
ncbi:MAG: hypothetical protein ABIO39_04500 [Caulobacteraceae bacterium]